MIYQTIKIKAKLRPRVIKVKANLAVGIQHYSPDIDIYTGEYEVTPKFEQIKLATENKVMTDDVVIKDIPVSITENLSGGNTVYIGG